MQSFVGGVAFGEVLLYSGVRSTPVAQTSVSVPVLTAPAALVGWSLRETTGASPATVRMRDGGDAEAPIVKVVAIAAGLSDNHRLGDLGTDLSSGLYLEVVSGSVEGAVEWRLRE